MVSGKKAKSHAKVKLQEISFFFFWPVAGKKIRPNLKGPLKVLNPTNPKPKGRAGGGGGGDQKVWSPQFPALGKSGLPEGAVPLPCFLLPFPCQNCAGKLGKGSQARDRTGGGRKKRKSPRKQGATSRLQGIRK